MSLPPKSYESTICTCGHCDFYHIYTSFKCVFTGCNCTGFVLESSLDEPDEIVEGEDINSATKASAVGGGTAGWPNMDDGDYMYY